MDQARHPAGGTLCIGRDGSPKNSRFCEHSQRSQLRLSLRIQNAFATLMPTIVASGGPRSPRRGYATLGVDKLAAHTPLTATQLAELAEAALILGQESLAERFLAAAYDIADGKPVEGVEILISEASLRAVADRRVMQLSNMQKVLLGVAGAMRPT